MAFLSSWSDFARSGERCMSGDFCDYGSEAYNIESINFLNGQWRRRYLIQRLGMAS